MSDSAFDKTLEPWTQVKSLAVRALRSNAGMALMAYVLLTYVGTLALLAAYWSKLDKLDIIIVLVLLGLRAPTTALVVALLVVNRLPNEAYVGASQSRRSSRR